MSHSTLLTLPVASWAQNNESITDLTQQVSQQLQHTEQAEQDTTSTASHGQSLIGDLAWILLLGAIATIIFKKLKQPVVLGYILAGFLASPNFTYLPSISNLENINFWAELGIVVLMFTLGLEFSFKKLMKNGADAIVPALIIITGMTFAGFGVGKLLDFDAVNCIFLGGMISMSSTTIILKALTDLGLKQKKFASGVLAVLILEDLLAVVMLVLLSSIAVGNVEGSELIYSIAKLVFFLVIWFVVGVYLLPPLFTRGRTFLNNETLLVISMGLCFGMAVFSVACGFSLELGAFVTGSILAGTMLAERIEKVVQPIKDLFGAVFFISVGMMVDPGIIVQYWPQILLLAAVVITGMITFGTIGMLLGGRTLKEAMQSGFTLTQIGEFSFIIATLGMSLGVLQAEIYPIIVAVSVITIFTTPYFIRMAEPAYRFTDRHLPDSLRVLIDRYTNKGSDTSDTRRLWRTVLTRYLIRVAVFSIVLIAIIGASTTWFFPIMIKLNATWGRLTAVLITLVAMSPFLAALLGSSTSKSQRRQLHRNASINDVPLVALRVIRYIVVFIFIFYFITLSYGGVVGWLFGAATYVVLVVLASTRLKKRYDRIEQKFFNNLNMRDNTRLGVNNNIISDLHLAYVEVGPGCPFVGDRLRDAGLRRDYGVSVSSIQRGMNVLPIPDKDTRIFPGDVLGVIGTDDQIKHLNDDIEAFRTASEALPVSDQKIDLISIRLTQSSPLAGKTIAESRVPERFHSMLVKIQHPDGNYSHPLPDTLLQPDDVVWIVGYPQEIDKLK